jgi:hypothetical protein
MMKEHVGLERLPETFVDLPYYLYKLKTIIVINGGIKSDPTLPKTE